MPRPNQYTRIPRPAVKRGPTGTCESCGEQRTYTISSRRHQTEPVLTSMHVCSGCKHRWVTMRVPYEALPAEIRALAHPSVLAQAGIR